MQPTTFIFLTLSILGQVVMTVALSGRALDKQRQAFWRVVYSFLALTFLSVSIGLIWLLVFNKLSVTIRTSPLPGRAPLDAWDRFFYKVVANQGTKLIIPFRGKV